MCVLAHGQRQNFVQTMQGRGQRAVCSARENEQPPNAVIKRMKFKTVCFAWQTTVRMACWFMCEFSLFQWSDFVCVVALTWNNPV